MHGSPAIEPESILVEIGLEVMFMDATLMGSAKPTLEQGGYQMNMREKLEGTFRVALDGRNPMSVPGRLYPVVSVPVVRMHFGSFHDAVADETDQTHSRSVR